MHADALHGLLEQLPVLRLTDGFEVSTDQFNAESLESAVLCQCNSQIQSGLPTHCWKESIRFLLFDHSCDNFRSERLNVGPIRHLRIGHDRCRIGVD